MHGYGAAGNLLQEEYKEQGDNLRTDPIGQVQTTDETIQVPLNLIHWGWLQQGRVGGEGGLVLSCRAVAVHY